MIRHVIRGEKKKRSSREVTFASKRIVEEKGGRGEKAFSIDEYFCSSYEKS